MYTPKQIGEDIPFTTFVDLPGVNPGDSITVSPIVEHVGFELIDPSDAHGHHDDDSYDPCDPYVEDSHDVLFRRLIQRTVICLIVRASQEVAIRVATAPLPITAITPITPTTAS